MRKLIRGPLLGAAAFLCWAALPATADAQMFSNAEMQRGLWPGVYVPYDGAPLTQRYNFQTGGFLYFNGNSRNMYQMDYFDRRERAEKFGYRMPADPFRRVPAPVYAPAPPCCDAAVAPAVYYYRR